MKSLRQMFWLGPFLLLISISAQAQPHCDISSDLSASIAEFNAQQVSRIEALLMLGEQYNLCLGIEYVDRNLLTDLVDIHVKSGTAATAIDSILSPTRGLTIERRNGAIEIRQRVSADKVRNIFGYVIPKWESSRGPIQVVSLLLHWALVSELNHQLSGFGGHTGGGNPQDLVGPFNENDQSVRDLLDKVVAQSKGAAWISEVSGDQVTDLGLPEKRRIWMIVEYGGPKDQYPDLLRAIADQLPPQVK